MILHRGGGCWTVLSSTKISVLSCYGQITKSLRILFRKLFRKEFTTERINLFRTESLAVLMKDTLKEIIFHKALMSLVCLCFSHVSFYY